MVAAAGVVNTAGCCMFAAKSIAVCLEIAGANIVDNGRYSAVVEGSVGSQRDNHDHWSGTACTAAECYDKGISLVEEGFVDFDEDYNVHNSSNTGISVVAGRNSLEEAADP